MSEVNPPKRFTRLRRWTVEAVIFIALLWGIGLFQSRHHLGTGKAAPNEVFPVLTGGTQTLESLRGKPVILTFWAPWCKVCAAESDNIERVRQWREGGAHVISIAVGYQSVEQVNQYVREQKVQYPVWLGSEATLEAWHVNQFPTTYFLNAEGNIRGSVVGYTTTLSLWFRSFL